jgi:hypothetical protein
VRRLQEVLDIVKRIRFVLLPMWERAQLVASLVIPRALYGSKICCLPRKVLRGLRTAVLSAIWGTRRRRRSPEVVLTLFVRGHAVDPEQAVGFRALRVFRKMVQSRADVCVLVEAVRFLYEQGRERVPGPIGAARDVEVELRQPFCAGA